MPPRPSPAMRRRARQREQLQQARATAEDIVSRYEPGVGGMASAGAKVGAFGAKALSKGVIGGLTKLRLGGQRKATVEAIERTGSLAKVRAGRIGAEIGKRIADLVPETEGMIRKIKPERIKKIASEVRAAHGEYAKMGDKSLYPQVSTREFVKRVSKKGR